MSETVSGRTAGTPRRGFLGGLAAGAAALVVGRWSTAGAELAPLPLTSAPAGDEWLSKVKGKYRQVFDATSPNEGFPPVFALTFINTTKDAQKLTTDDVSAVVVFRHFAMPMLLNDKIWAKYKIGELINVKDPKTNAPATRNIFRAEMPLNPGLTYEQVIATRPVVFAACNMALTVFSGMAAPKAGVTADAAKKEWTANLVAGVALVPSGVYAVNRAQQTGCTYCWAG